MIEQKEESEVVATVKPVLKLFAPLAYNQVISGVYRSSYPTPRNYPFIEKLNLKSFVCLVPTDINEELRNYCTKHTINLFEFDVKVNQEPFVSMDVNEVRKAVHAIAGNNQI